MKDNAYNKTVEHKNRFWASLFLVTYLTVLFPFGAFAESGSQGARTYAQHEELALSADERQKSTADDIEVKRSVVEDDTPYMSFSDRKLYDSTLTRLANERERTRSGGMASTVPSKKNISIGKNIGKKGGTINLLGASIEIPDGALEEKTKITIERIASVEDTGEFLQNTVPGFGGYRFLPAGTQFKKDVVITLPYNEELNRSDALLEELYTYFYDTENESWVKLERLEVDTEKCVVRSLTTHFTDMITATLALPESAGPANVNLTSIKNLEANVPDSHLIKFNPPEASNMGDASFSFELGVPAGRKGVEPSVILSYSSGGGDGIVGKGFDVSWGSSITTDTRLGLPNYATQDRYMLDGILLEEKNGGEGNYTFHYREKKESAYRRIVRYGAGSENDSWEVTDKNGVKRIYEQNKNATVGNGARTFKWNVTRMEDARGNNVIYEYIKDDGYVYPSEIFYTGYGSDKGRYSVSFHYDYDGNPTREDVRTDARSKSVVACKKLLTSITTHYDGGDAIRSYEFFYDEGLAKEKKLIELRVKNNAGQSYSYTFGYVEPDYIDKEKTQLDYFEGKKEWTNGNPIKTGNSTSGSGSFSTSVGVGVGDISGVVDVRLTGGVQGDFGKGNSKSEEVLIDVNADGRLDSVWVTGGKLHYRLNNGKGFSEDRNVSIESFVIDRENNQSISIGGNLYGGGGVQSTMAFGLGASYSNVKQINTSNTFTTFMDMDRDGKVDVLLSGKSYYLKNVSEGDEVKFEKADYSDKSTIIKNVIIPPSDTERKEYEKTYRVHTPFRQWVSAHTGTIEVEENIERLKKEPERDIKAETYKGNEQIPLFQMNLSDGKETVSFATKVKKGDELYFITKVNEPRESDVNWNVKIKYKDIKPYSSRIPVPEFYPRDDFKDEETSLSEEDAKKEARKKLGSVSPLYDISITKDSNDKKILMIKLKNDWEKYAREHDCTQAFYQLLEENRFIPGAFSEEQFEKLVETFGKNLGEYSKPDGKEKDAWERFASCFLHDITSAQYIVKKDRARKNDKSNLYFPLFDFLTKYAQDVLRESWSNYTQYGIKAGYSGSEIFYTAQSSFMKMNQVRQENESGSVLEKGNVIVLGKLDGKQVSVNKTNGEVFLDKILSQKHKAKVFQDENALSVRITTDGTKEVINYRLRDLSQKAHNILDDEMQLIFNDFTKDGDSIEDEYWNWKGTIEDLAKKALVEHGIEKEDQEKFLENAFDKTVKETVTFYTRKESLTRSEREVIEAILFKAKEKRILENDFPFYTKTVDGGYVLKNEWEEDFKTPYTVEQELLMNTCKKHGLGKYGLVKVLVQYSEEEDYQLDYELNESSFASFRIVQNTIDVVEEKISIGVTEWDSKDAWSGIAAKDERALYSQKTTHEVKNEIEEEVKDGEKITKKPVTKVDKIEVIENVTVERKEKLFAGNKNWFFGVWIDGETGFTGETISKLLYPDEADYRGKKGEYEKLKTMNEDEAKNKKTDTDMPFYLPIENKAKEELGDNNIYPVKEEKGSGKTESELENVLLGQVGMSLSEDEQSGEMQSEYYFAFIERDYIHASRSGGSAYYDIDGLYKDEDSSVGFLFPSVRKTRNEGNDQTFGINVDISASGVEEIDSFTKGEDKITQELVSGVNGGLGKTQGKNTSYGGLTQTVMDMTGDGIPDIVQKNGSEVKVIKGELTEEGIKYSYDENYCIKADSINSTSSKVDVFGATISSGGSITNQYKTNGAVSGVKTSASASGGAGRTKTDGSSESNRGFIDMNGDGLPDYYDSHIDFNGTVKLKEGTRVFLGRGEDNLDDKEYFKSNVMQSMNSSKIKSVSVNVNAGKAASRGESLTTGVNVGTGASYCVSSNTSTEMLLDINGDGLPDRVSQNGRVEVRYNTGSGFADAKSIFIPAWKIGDSDKKELKHGKDVNFELGSFENIPLVGKLAKDITNSLPVYNAFAETNLNSLDFSSTISLSLSGNLGLSFTFPVKIPIAGISINMTCAGGNGLSGSTSVNMVNVSMMDINGDGLPDQVLRIPGGNGATYWKKNKSGQWGLLNKVETPQGGSVSIKYEEKYGTSDNPIFKYVMSEVTVDDGTGKLLSELNRGATSVTTKYEYDKGYYDRSIKDFYGYSKVVTTFADGSKKIDEYHNREYHLKGCIAKSTTYGVHKTDRGIVDTYRASEKFTDWSDRVALPVREETHTYEYESGSYNFIKTEKKYEYDEYGNCIEYIQKFGNTGSAVLKANISYAKRQELLDAYIVSLPEEMTVTDETNSRNDKVLRHRKGVYNEYGDLTELKQFYDETSSSDYTFEYDKYGNILTRIDPRGATLSYEYDTLVNQFVEKVTQSGKGTDSYESTFGYDIATQTKTLEKDENANELTYKYDEWQRVKEIRTSYDTGDIPSVSYEYFTPQVINANGKQSGHSFWYAITKNKVTFDSDDKTVIQTVVQVDGLGRKVRTAKTGVVNGVEGWNASGAVVYDEKARVIKEGMTEFIEGSLEDLLSPPNAPKMTKYFKIYEYDSLDRKIKTILPDTKIDDAEERPTYKVSYLIERNDAARENELVTRTTDPLGNISEQRENALGFVVRVSREDSSRKELTSASYEYDLLGQMLGAFDAAKNPIGVEYDLLGRRTALESLDGGRQEFFYDEASNLVRENNAVLREKHKQIVYEYDGLNRLSRVDYPETKDTVYTYGKAFDAKRAANKVLRVEDASGSTEFEYGMLSEVVKETKTLSTHLNNPHGDVEKSITEYRSDYLGRMQHIIYPDGEKVFYKYDAGGQVVSVTGKNFGRDFNYVTNILYDEYGQRTRIDYGNGTHTEYKYDEARRWLDSILTVNKHDEVYQNIVYDFDDVGNVRSYTNDCLDKARGNYKTRQEYEYDALYQLVKASGKTTYNPYRSMNPEHVSSYEQKFAFDAAGLGNMVSKVSHEDVRPSGKSLGDGLNYSFDYVYDENFAHRLVRAGNRWYKYDSNGNVVFEKDLPEGMTLEDDSNTVSLSRVQTIRENVFAIDEGWGLFANDSPSARGRTNKRSGGRTYTWNERNQLVATVDDNKSTSYVYDYNGTRTNKYSRGSETIYFNQFYSMRFDGGVGYGSGQSVKHIYLGDTRIVTKLNSVKNASYQEEVYKQYYYHSDHLGSASLISDFEGREYQRIEYTPYGETWVEKSQNTGMEYLPYKFTGKERDEETGLYYYGARYLDPQYSRWMSCDPALGDFISGNSTSGGVYNHINLNLYHYSNNNPIIYIDPDGRDSGYLNDSEAVGIFGHSAMFVETYDQNGKSTGFSLYEVGPLKQVDGQWYGVDKDGNPLLDSHVLSQDKLDSSMGCALGSVASASGASFGSGVASGVVGSVAGSAVVDGLQVEAAGVSVRKYSSYEEMRNAPENKRYDNVIRFSTNQQQDKAILNHAQTTGASFGKYNLFTNNCTQNASASLAAGGIKTTHFLIPNSARNYILKNNSAYTKESWRR